LGVRVNTQLQPVDADGEVISPNLFAIGGILAGADRISEGSREGIDLATAWKVVGGLTVDGGPKTEERRMENDE
jgi:anaerobic glycerol-3-phosphate dehydrogenase